MLGMVGYHHKKLGDDELQWSENNDHQMNSNMQVSPMIPL